MKESTKQDRRQELLTLIESFSISGNMHVVERLTKELRELNESTLRASRRDNDNVGSGEAGRGDKSDSTALVQEREVASLED